MAWTIPTAKQIAASLIATLEAGILKVRPDLDPIVLSRTLRTPIGVFAQIMRAVALAFRVLHDHLAWWGRQYFIDSCDEEFVYRHAGMWDVDQRPATTAIGEVLIEGAAGTSLPALLEITTSSGLIYTTDVAASISSFGTVTVPATASTAGISGNLEAGIRMQTLGAFPEISRITVASAFADGADAETAEELRTAVQERIRQPPHGGAIFDYASWIRPKFAVQAVGVIEDWIGRGSLGVVIAMRNPDGTTRAPTTEELGDIALHLKPLRPVTARVIVVPAVPRTVDLTLRLRPDNVATRKAVTEAWQRFVVALGDEDDERNDSPIGAVIEPSRISEALSAAGGEYAHDLISPAAPLALERTEIAVPGVPTFVEA